MFRACYGPYGDMIRCPLVCASSAPWFHPAQAFAANARPSAQFLVYQGFYSVLSVYGPTQLFQYPWGSSLSASNWLGHCTWSLMESQICTGDFCLSYSRFIPNRKQCVPFCLCLIVPMFHFSSCIVPGDLQPVGVWKGCITLIKNKINTYLTYGSESSVAKLTAFRFRADSITTISEEETCLKQSPM